MHAQHYESVSNNTGYVGSYINRSHTCHNYLFGDINDFFGQWRFRDHVVLSLFRATRIVPARNYVTVLLTSNLGDVVYNIYGCDQLNLLVFVIYLTGT